MGALGIRLGYGDAFKAFAQGGAQTGPYSATFAGQTGWPMPGASPAPFAAGPGGLPPPARGAFAFGPGAPPVYPHGGPPQGGAGLGLPGHPYPGGVPAGPGFGLQPPATPADGASGAGLTEADLAYLASAGRWGGLGNSLKRAAPEIYRSMRQGNANVREWFRNAWGTGAQTQQQKDLWHTATLCDFRVDELLQSGTEGLVWGSQHDDMLEGMLRQLAAALNISAEKTAKWPPQSSDSRARRTR